MEIERLLSRIDAYCAAHELSPSTFGRKAVNDGKFVDRLKSGKTITLQTLSRVDRFMATPPGPLPKTRGSNAGVAA